VSAESEATKERGGRAPKTATTEQANPSHKPNKPQPASREHENPSRVGPGFRPQRPGGREPKSAATNAPQKCDGGGSEPESQNKHAPARPLRARKPKPRGAWVPPAVPGWEGTKERGGERASKRSVLAYLGLKAPKGRTRSREGAHPGARTEPRPRAAKANRSHHARNNQKHNAIRTTPNTDRTQSPPSSNKSSGSTSSNSSSTKISKSSSGAGTAGR
jgi:hypothetical protein